MKFGIFLSAQQTLDDNPIRAFHDQIDLVRLVRDKGWDSFFTGQHYLSDGNVQHLQNLPFLARLKAEAGGMTLGIGVLLINLHNPVYVAETVATMDVVAEGNMVFGVGLGYRGVEFDAFGVRRGERVKRFVDCLELVKRLWTEESVSFESEYCTLKAVRMNMRPVQKPHPPIWFAANNDPAVRRAAHMGDTLFINPHATTQTIARQMDVYREGLREAGKPAPEELPCMKEVFCAKDRKTALELAGPYLGQKYKDYARWGQDKALPEDETFDQPFADLLQDRFVIGSPEDCYEQLKPYRDMGVNHLIIRTSWIGMPAASALESARLISDELMPALKGNEHEET